MEHVEEVVGTLANVRHRVVLVVKGDKTEFGEELCVMLAELVDDGANVLLQCGNILK